MQRPRICVHHPYLKSRFLVSSLLCLHGGGVWKTDQKVCNSVSEYPTCYRALLGLEGLWVIPTLVWSAVYELFTIISFIMGNIMTKVIL